MLLRLAGCCFAAVLIASSAFAETIYFKNKRTIEATSYEVKGHLIFVSMTNGGTVYLKADSVDWEATERLKDSAYELTPTAYEEAGSESYEEGGASGPVKRMTANDIKKPGAGIRRRGAAAGLAVEVPAATTWVDSRINVRAGQVVTLRASGLATLAIGVEAGPEGTTATSAPGAVWLPAAPFGALLARIGLAGDVLLVGSGTRLSAPQSGRLFFTVNDRTADDNTGSFTVRVILPSEGTEASVSGGGAAAGGPAAPGPASGHASPGRRPASGMLGSIDRARAASAGAATAAAAGSID